MNNCDRDQFKNVWLDVAGLLPGKPPSDSAIDLCFEVLRRYSLVEVVGALQKHLEHERWMPAPADVIALIDGQSADDAVDLSDSDLYSLALEGKTPLGVWVRYLATSFTILNRSRVEALGAISARRPQIDRFIEEHRNGKLSQDAIRVLSNRQMRSTPLLRVVEVDQQQPQITHDEPDAKVVGLADGVLNHMPGS